MSILDSVQLYANMNKCLVLMSLIFFFYAVFKGAKAKQTYSSYLNVEQSTQRFGTEY